MLDFHSSKGRPFRFLERWVEHLVFSDFIKENWRVSASTSIVHSEFADQVKRWNKDVYGHIATRKKLLTKKLQSIEIERDIRNSTYLNQVEMEVKGDLENVLHHEEILWRQKARCDWSVLRDRNTNFFHTRTLRRRKQNQITILKTGLGEWIMDEEQLKIEAVNFYTTLHGSRK
ncbi:hypothetical protein PVK06_026890 [Gossypium arboreum]|uniref:Uncharacterized protein n=1 Tax=Gossypium arboreum TaxID=29729 RepID=A0ABR0NYY3_GOSAR|nr:hypothetical protein PVK06_026890 [Gossypium arboreum]